VAGDSVDYLLVANNLKQPRSFPDYAGGINLYWPPLYPVLLAVSSWLLNVGTFQVGGWINAISFGLLVVMGGLLFSIFTVYELVIKPLDRWRPPPKFGVKLPEIIMKLILIGWMLYPLYQTAEYVYVAITQGEPSYNFYNTQAYNDSQLVQYLKENELDPQMPRYSNFAAAAYFFTGHSTLRAPRSPLLVARSLDHLETEFADCPVEEQAYLIWFPQNSWHHYYPPEELKTVANLERIIKSRDGDVYLVRPK